MFHVVKTIETSDKPNNKLVLIPLFSNANTTSAQLLSDEPIIREVSATQNDFSLPDLAVLTI